MFNKENLQGQDVNTDHGRDEGNKDELVITKDMLISEVIQRKPRTIELLMMVGLGCIGCPASMMESIEQGAMTHGIDPDVLVQKLNEY